MSNKLEAEFEIKRKLGKGAFGTVYCGKERASGEMYALKIIQVSGNKSARDEIAALCRLPEHVNIISYSRNIRLEAGQICLVMEYCSGGNLNDLLVSKEPNESCDLRFMRQIASAVAFLHSNGVVHRDLKPDNILVTGYGTLKVADFGIAKIASDSHYSGSLYDYYMQTYAGSTIFMAPEVFDRRYTEKADVFSLGVIFACILERKIVLRTQTGRRVVGIDAAGEAVGKALHDGQLSRYRMSGEIQASQQLRALVETMLDKDHRRRPAASRVDEGLKECRVTARGVQGNNKHLVDIAEAVAVGVFVAAGVFAGGCLTWLMFKYIRN